MHPSAGHSERVASEDDIIPLGVPVVDQKTGKTITAMKVQEGQVRYSLCLLLPTTA